jgi:hypothetical protein
MKRNVLYPVIFLLVPILLAGMAYAALQPPALIASAADSESLRESESQARRLEGTWRMQVTIRNCQTGDPLRDFPAYLSFAQGGTLTETTTGFSPSLRSPGHGIWQRSGGHNYSAVTEAFLFNPAGEWVGGQKLTMAITVVAADQINVTATNQLFDTEGNLTLSGCATAVGQRMKN